MKRMEKKKVIEVARGKQVNQAGRDLYILNGEVSLFGNSGIDFVYTINNDISVVSYFAGRIKEMDEIKRKIEEGCKKIIVTGVGGIGKTNFCRYLFNWYLELYKNGEVTYFERIGYLTYNNNFDMTLINGVKYTKCENYTLDLDNAWNVLQEISVTYKTLLIVDNLNNYIHQDSSLEKLYQLPCTIIITSRFNSYRDFEQVKLTPLDFDTCKKIFFSVYQEAKEDENIHLLKNIIDVRAARHTYTIEILAKISQSLDWSIKELDDNLNRYKFEIDYEEEGMQKSLVKEYEKLFKMSKLSQEEINILEAFALLPYVPLHSKDCYALIKEDASIEESQGILNSLYNKGWILKKTILYNASCNK